MKRLILALTILVTIFLLSTSIVLAVGTPDTLVINNLDAYQSGAESNDQLYIATFEISDSANISQDANDAFLFRLYDSGVEIATSTPSNFYNGGYTQGAIGFYFASDDANLPTWGTANITLQLVGNPSIIWDAGDPPSITYPSVDSWNTLNTPALVGARVRLIALALEGEWGIDLIGIVNGVYRLATYGESYFIEAIPNITTISPSLFTSSVTSPSFPSDNHSSTGATQTRWLTSGNGTFDVTNAATSLGIEVSWLKSLLWIISSVTLLVGMSYGVNKINNEDILSMIGMRPALYLFGFMLIIGSFMEFMVMQAGLFCGIAGGLILVFAFFWRGSP